jgi:hypothetical protein
MADNVTTTSDTPDAKRRAAAAAVLGRLGGLKGGRAKSEAKTRAARANIKKRWDKQRKKDKGK